MKKISLFIAMSLDPARHHAPYAGPQVRQGHPAQGPVRKVQGLRFALP